MTKCILSTNLEELKFSPFAKHTPDFFLHVAHPGHVDMGFGSLLEFARAFLPHHLVMQLLSRVDCKQETLTIVTVTVSIKPLIWKIVGLPSGPAKVPFLDWLGATSVKEHFDTITLASLKMGLGTIKDKKEFQRS